MDHSFLRNRSPSERHLIREGLGYDCSPSARWDAGISPEVNPSAPCLQELVWMPGNTTGARQTGAVSQTSAPTSQASSQKPKSLIPNLTRTWQKCRMYEELGFGCSTCLLLHDPSPIGSFRGVFHSCFWHSTMQPSSLFTMRAASVHTRPNLSRLMINAILSQGVVIYASGR